MEKSDSLYFAPMCPHLGMKHDPVTSFAYPSLGNYCRHCQPPAVPTMGHQGAYCLRDAHQDCLVYQGPPDQEFILPLKARAYSRRTPTAGKLVAALAVALLVFAGWWTFTHLPAPQGREAAPLAAPMTPLISPSRTAVSSETPPPPRPSKTSIMETATAAQSPTSRSTSSPQVHALEFPLKVGEHSFLMHRIREGENFEVLEETYVTSAGAILALNYSLSSPLWVNSVIVISPGLQEVDPKLPAFQPYEVTDKKISIDELAQQLYVNADLLRYYNNCPDNCHLSAGDWIMVPFLEP